MENKNLSKMPLIEATMELHWQLNREESEGMETTWVDPHYKILLSRFLDKVSGDGGKYPFYKELPNANIPESYAAYVVQHRFFSAENEPPVVQLGPGVITLHSTKEYTWSDFKERIHYVIQTLYSSHPHPEKLQFTNFSIRYNNVVLFDYSNNDVISFLKEKLHIGISYPNSLMEDDNIDSKPSDINFYSEFRTKMPKGNISLRVGAGSGTENGEEVILFSINFNTEALQPIIDRNFDEWLESIHLLIEKWFFVLIEGELEEEFA